MEKEIKKRIAISTRFGNSQYNQAISEILELLK